MKTKTSEKDEVKAPRKEDVRYGAAVTDRIVAYLKRGVSYNAMVRLPRMPTRETITEWRTTWPEFREITDQAVDAAKTARRDGPPTQFTLELGLQYCLRVAEGRVKADICHDLDMPSSDTISRWLVEEPSFEPMLVAAREGLAGDLIDQTRVIADRATSKDLSVAKLQVSVRQFAAGRPGTSKTKVEENEKPIINVEVVRFGHQIQDD